MPQLAYSTTLSPALPGMKADAGYDRVGSRVNLNASPIPYGVFVKELTATFLNGADVMGAAGDRIAGVTLKSDAQAVESSLVGATDAIPNAAIFSCMEMGAVWCRAEQVMVPGDPVFARYASGAGGTVRGVVRKDADTATAVAVPNSRVMKNGVSPAGAQMVCIYFVKTT
jgi:hypothetical protein